MGYAGWEDFDPDAPKKDRSRQFAGARSQEIGAAFEARILDACLYYKQNQQAYIDKTPEPFKVLGGRKRNGKGLWVFEGVFTSPAQPDFQGTLKGGRSVVFEAKVTEADRIERRVVTDTQQDALRYHFGMGAAAFVLVSFGLRSYYRVPWTVWDEMKRHAGRLYIKESDISVCAVSKVNGIIRFLG